MFSLIMGSNFGANVTLIGALAGLLWVNILKSKGVSMSYLEFLKYGMIITPPVVFSSCLVLAIEFCVVYGVSM